MSPAGNRRAPRQHNRRACRLPNRPRIRNGFLHWSATLFRIRMTNGPTPFLELRRLVDDQVPATGQARQRGVRSDLIESICLVVYCLLARMDLRSLRVGHHANDGRKHDFVGLTRQTLASWCGLSEETVSRVLTLLRHAGLVHGPGRDKVNVIGQPYDREPGRPTEWHPAIRRFDELFFLGLGLGAWLHEKRTEKPAAPAGPGDRAAVGPKAGRQLVAELANRLALERPPPE